MVACIQSISIFANTYVTQLCNDFNAKNIDSTKKINFSATKWSFALWKVSF